MPITTPGPPRDVARVTLSVLGIGVLIGGSFWVLRPFLGALVWATTIVVATWPMLLSIQSRLGGRRGPAVAVMTLTLLLVLFVPLYLAVSTIVEQSDRIAALVRMLPTLEVPAPPQWVRDVPLVGDRAAERWTVVAEDPQRLKEALAPRLRTAVAWLGAQAGSFGSMLLHFLLTVLVSAILYAKGEGAAEQLRRFFRRLSGERGDAIVELAGKAIRAVALGVVVTAVVQSTIAGIGLAAMGVPFAGLLAAIAFILCIAQLGPLLAMLPGVVWLYASGSAGRGTVLLVVMVGAQAIDNVLRPLLIKKGGADLSLLLIIAGVVGGLLWLGVIGLFVGPVVLAVTSTLLDGWIAAGLGEAKQEPAPVATTPGDTPQGGSRITPT
jgi:predicted PurR-regulated permease PerM